MASRESGNAERPSGKSGNAERPSDESGNARKTSKGSGKSRLKSHQPENAGTNINKIAWDDKLDKTGNKIFCRDSRAHLTILRLRRKAR